MSINDSYDELPECVLTSPPELIPPASKTTPRHTLYLSNLDDQHFIRFTIKYLFLYDHKYNSTSTTVQSLKSSLASILVHYYPLAGRLRSSAVLINRSKLELECTGEGAMFVEAFMDITAQDFMTKQLPNKSWRKLLFREEGYTFLTGPPLLIQATRLRCGGMILCVGINHCLCDGIGSAQFLNAWADVCRNAAAAPDLAVTAPCWNREALRPLKRIQQQIQLPHPEYNQLLIRSDINYNKRSTSDAGPKQQEPLVPISISFGSEAILQLKKLCISSSSSSSSSSLYDDELIIKHSCTSFEVLAAHVWRCWARSIGPSNPRSKVLKLLFSVDIRTWMDPPLPEGYYGNGFVLACAECDPAALVAGGIGNLSGAVRAVQRAKEAARSDSHVRSVVELLEEHPRAIPDLGSSLVISQWSGLGLERVDFGSGKPIHVGPMTSEVYCVLLPATAHDAVNGGVTVLMSVPESKAQMFKMLLMLQQYSTTTASDHHHHHHHQHQDIYNNNDDIHDQHILNGGGNGMDDHHQLIVADHQYHEQQQVVVACSSIIAYSNKSSTTPAAAAAVQLESF